MPFRRAAVLVSAAVLAAPAAAGAATWSAPQRVSPAHTFVEDTALIVSRNGRALASWTTGRGVFAASRAPGASAFGPARRLDGVETMAAYGRTGALAAGVDGRRLTVRFGHTDGTFGTPRTIRRADRIRDVSLAANDNGDAALAWFEDRGTRSDRVYVALRRAGRAFDAPRRLATGRIRRVAVAIGASADVLVAWNSPGKQLTRFKPRGRASFLGIDRLRSKPAFQVDMHPVVTITGRAALAWSSQLATEGGGSGPLTFEVAVRPFGADRFRPAQVLEQLGDDPLRRPVDAVVTNARQIVVAWSGLEGDERRVRVAQLEPGRLRFPAPQTVSPTGRDAYLSDLASDDATGRLLAVWDDGFDAGQVSAALAEGGGQPFGAPEAVSPLEQARAGHAAFDPRTHVPTVVYSNRPEGSGTYAEAATRSGT